jgi:hypothetical protein
MELPVDGRIGGNSGRVFSAHPLFDDKVFRCTAEPKAKVLDPFGQ